MNHISKRRNSTFVCIARLAANSPGFRLLLDGYHTSRPVMETSIRPSLLQMDRSAPQRYTDCRSYPPVSEHVPWPSRRSWATTRQRPQRQSHGAISWHETKEHSSSPQLPNGPFYVRSPWRFTGRCDSTIDSFAWPGAMGCSCLHSLSSSIHPSICQQFAASDFSSPLPSDTATI